MSSSGSTTSETTMGSSSPSSSSLSPTDTSTTLTTTRWSSNSLESTAASVSELLSLAATLTDTRDEAADNIAAAKETKVTAANVGDGLDSIDSLIDDLLDATKKRSRREGSTSSTTTFPKPTTCSEFLSALQLVTAALTLDHDDYNPARALQIVNILKTLSSDDFSCDASEVDSLKEEVETG